MTPHLAPLSENPTSGPHTPHDQRPVPRRRSRRLGWIAAASILAGLIAAVLSVVVVFAGAHEPVIDGTALLSFAAGWALLWGLSTRFTDQPQRWAAVPAAAMTAAGTALLVFEPTNAVLDAVGWVWPPALLALVVWMGIQVHRQLPGALAKSFVYPVLAFLLLAAIGGGYHTVRQSLDGAAASAAPGQLIDVGDHQLYLSCTGSGDPTVVMEPGLGETSAAWGWIAPTVADRTRVCLYDRAGRGRSDPAAAAQDGAQTAADLHTLLDRADVTGPLVMVGHSLGGLYALNYAAKYPEQVAGMVLIDATPPTALTELPDYPAFYDTYRTATALFPGLARLGLTGLVFGTGHADLPEQARDQARADSSTAGHARSQRDELAMAPTAMTQARTLITLGDTPLYVLTAPVDAQPGWLPTQTNLASLSNNSIHQVVAGADHAALLDNQVHAVVTSQSILQVVTAARTDAPLAGV